MYVNGSVVFSNSDLKKLEENNLPTKLLHLNDKDKISKNLKEYLSIGEEKDIHNRYKCKIRNNWYVIPNVSEKPDAFFFKRSHLYPKLLKNNSDAFVTDSAYKIEMKNGYNINSFIFSFYNTLTLILSEIEGRYYGGGVLELTPNEFKKLAIPYVEISDFQFQNFTNNFENKNNIEQILAQNDYKILNSILNLSQEDIEKLISIRQKLLKKRMRY
ncbi:Modification methylase Eco57IB [Flavobacterium sp. ACN2]|nr:Modification methylase Eco57IB [Flavobacterium sp. ACN2]